MNINKNIKVIKIVLPWWLKWTKRYITLEVGELKIPKSIKYAHFSGVTLDEVKLL